MVVDFTDLIVLDIAFDDVVSDDVTFEDSAIFTIEFEDYALHPFKHYLQHQIAPRVSATGNLTGVKFGSGSVVIDVAITSRLTRLAGLPAAEVLSLASTSGSLTRIKTAVPVSSTIETYVNESLTRILDGHYRRIRALVKISSRLSLKGPLTGSCVIGTFASVNPLTATTVLDASQAAMLTTVAGTLVRVKPFGPTAASPEAAIVQTLLRIKTAGPATAIIKTTGYATAGRAKILAPVSAVAVVAITSSMRAYESLKGDDEHTLYGDDDEQLGDTF